MADYHNGEDVNGVYFNACSQELILIKCKILNKCYIKKRKLCQLHGSVGILPYNTDHN